MTTVVRYRHAAGRHWARGRLIATTSTPTGGVEAEVIDDAGGRWRTLDTTRHFIEVEHGPGRWVPIEVHHQAPQLPFGAVS